jgi:hypothetical protein
MSKTPRTPKTKASKGRDPRIDPRAGDILEGFEGLYKVRVTGADEVTYDIIEDGEVIVEANTKTMQSWRNIMDEAKVVGGEAAPPARERYSWNASDVILTGTRAGELRGDAVARAALEDLADALGDWDKELSLKDIAVLARDQLAEARKRNKVLRAQLKILTSNGPDAQEALDELVELATSK